MEQLDLDFSKSVKSLTEYEDSRILLQVQSEAIKNCQKCDLHKARTQTVFGEGDPQARVVFCGEAPGQTEDETGRPFVGRAGKLLDNMIESIGLKRDEVYILNICKCRPPGNRTPSPYEMEACLPYLRDQLEIIKPEIIVALGNTALGGLTGAGSGITRRCGAWEDIPPNIGLPQVALMPCYHPSALLRNPKWKEPAWHALQAVKNRLETK